MTKQKITRKGIKNEIERSVLMSEKDKKYWLNELKNLPESILKTLYETIKSKNETIDSYIETAIAEIPEKNLSSEVEKEVRSITKEAFAIEEKEQQSGFEEELEKELQQIKK